MLPEMPPFVNKPCDNKHNQILFVDAEIAEAHNPEVLALDKSGWKEP
jgi:hypothetical protein